MPKFAHGVVAGPSGLVPLAPLNAHSNVGRVDHADIVGAIANSQNNETLIKSIDEFDDFFFLERRDAAEDDGVERDELAHELLIEFEVSALFFE